MKLTLEALHTLKRRETGNAIREPHEVALWRALRELDGPASTGAAYAAYRRQALPRPVEHLTYRRMSDYLRRWRSEGKLRGTVVASGRRGVTTVWEMIQ